MRAAFSSCNYSEMPQIPIAIEVRVLVHVSTITTTYILLFFRFYSKSFHISFGLLCIGQHPPQLASEAIVDSSWTLSECTSRVGALDLWCFARDRDGRVCFFVLRPLSMMRGWARGYECEWRRPTMDDDFVASVYVIFCFDFLSRQHCFAYPYWSF